MRDLVSATGAAIAPGAIVVRIIATSAANPAIPAPVSGVAMRRAAYLPAEVSRGPVDFLVGFGVLLLFGLSGYALEYFGMPYLSDGGSILTKLHPSLYVFALTLGVAIIGNPEPITYATSLFSRRLGSVAVIAACGVIYVFVARYKPTMSAAYLGDAMISAALVALLLADSPAGARLWLARLIHAIVIANAMLAIVEVATHWRLFPFGIKGDYQVWDYRATAFFGHPLDGALVTGVYAVILMTARDIPGLANGLRLPVILLCMAAMPAIGARTSFAIVYGVAAVVVGLSVLRFLRGHGTSHATLLASLVGAALVPVVAVAAYQLGYLDGFLGRFESDSGSAETRVTLYNLFSHYGFHEMLTGYSPIEYRTRIRIEGLETGVENAWVGHLMQFGIPLSVMLWCALAALLADLFRSTGRYAVLPTLFMLLVISTSVGISGKTTMLVMPITVMLILLGEADATRMARKPAFSPTP